MAITIDIIAIYSINILGYIDIYVALELFLYTVSDDFLNSLLILISCLVNIKCLNILTI